MHKKKFTVNIRRFIKVYDGSCKRAASTAGISHGYARKLMLRLDVLEAIASRGEKETQEVDQAIINRKEIEIRLSEIIREGGPVTALKLRAIDLYCKINGWYSEKRVLEGSKDKPIEMNSNVRCIEIDIRKRLLGLETNESTQEQK